MYRFQHSLSRSMVAPQNFNLKFGLLMYTPIIDRCLAHYHIDTAQVLALN